MVGGVREVEEAAVYVYVRGEIIVRIQFEREPVPSSPSWMEWSTGSNVFVLSWVLNQSWTLSLPVGSWRPRPTWILPLGIFTGSSTQP